MTRPDRVSLASKFLVAYRPLQFSLFFCWHIQQRVRMRNNEEARIVRHASQVELEMRLALGHIR